MLVAKALRQWMKAATTAGLMAVVLAGCGVRAAPDYPTVDKADKADKAAPTSTATAESGQGKPEGAAPKPHKGFILDGLIR